MFTQGPALLVTVEMWAWAAVVVFLLLMWATRPPPLP